MHSLLCVDFRSYIQFLLQGWIAQNAWTFEMCKYWKTQSPVLLSLLIPRTYQLAIYVNLWKMEKLQLVFQLLNALKIHQINQVVPKSSGVFTTAERSICHLPWTWEAHREKVIFLQTFHIKFLYLWDFSNTIGFFDI